MTLLIWSLTPSWLGGVCEAEFRNGNLGAEASQGSAASRTPGLGPALCSALPQLSVSFGLGSRSPWGLMRNPVVLKQAYLGQPGALSSFLRLCSPLAGLQDAPCPHFLLIIQPLPPSLATASSTNSSNTIRIEFPAPQDMQFPASVPSLMLFLQTGMPFPAPPALSAWQTPVHPSQSPSMAPSSRKTTPCHPPPTPRLPLLFVNASLWHLSLCITCLHVCLPFQTVNPSGHGLYLMHLCILRLARCLAHSRRPINVK